MSKCPQRVCPKSRFSTLLLPLFDLCHGQLSSPWRFTQIEPSFPYRQQPLLRGPGDVSWEASRLLRFHTLFLMETLDLRLKPRSGLMFMRIFCLELWNRFYVAAPDTTPNKQACPLLWETANKHGRGFLNDRVSGEVIIWGGWHGVWGSLSSQEAMTVNNKPSTGRRPPHSRRGPKAAESGRQGWRAGPWLGLVKVQLEKQPEHGAD